MNYSVAFLGEFSKNEAQNRRRYEDISNRSDAGIVKVRISQQDKVTGWRLSVACLVNFVVSNWRPRKDLA